MWGALLVPTADARPRPRSSPAMVIVATDKASFLSDISPTSYRLAGNAGEESVIVRCGEYGVATVRPKPHTRIMKPRKPSSPQNLTALQVTRSADTPPAVPPKAQLTGSPLLALSELHHGSVETEGWQLSDPFSRRSDR